MLKQAPVLALALRARPCGTIPPVAGYGYEVAVAALGFLYRHAVVPVREALALALLQQLHRGMVRLEEFLADRLSSSRLPPVYKSALGRGRSRKPTRTR